MKHKISFQNKITKKSVMQFIKDYALLTSGALVMTIASYFFVLPCQLVTGGVGGITNVLFYWFGWKVSIVSIVLQAPLIVLALIMLKPSYTFKTAYACVMYSLFMSFWEITFPEIPSTPPDSVIMWLLFGGVVDGFSIVLAYWAGGSNGGSEIVSGIVLKKNPDAKIGNVLVAFNYCVYALALISFAATDGLNMASILRIVYSIIMSYVVSIAVDIFTHGVDPMLKYYIITEHPDQLTQILLQRFKRGVTGTDAVDAEGKPTGKKVLIFVIQFRQNNTVKHIIKKYDSDAFAFCKTVDAVVTRPDFNRRYK